MGQKQISTSMVSCGYAVIVWRWGIGIMRKPVRRRLWMGGCILAINSGWILMVISGLYHVILFLHMVYSYMVRLFRFADRVKVGFVAHAVKFNNYANNFSFICRIPSKSQGLKYPRSKSKTVSSYILISLSKMLRSPVSVAGVLPMKKSPEPGLCLPLLVRSVGFLP